MVKNINFTSLAIAILLVVTLPVHSAQTEQQKLLERIDIIKQASSINGLWRETKNLSDSAKKHANAENFTLAKKILMEAEFQAKQGIQQAQEQTDINVLIPSYLQH